MIYSTNIKDSVNKVNSYITLQQIQSPNQRYVMLQPGASSGIYTDMEYDLSETGRILDTESFVATAFRKKRHLITKEGFKLSSSNPSNLKYVEKRLEEIEYVTGKPFKEFIEEVVENLVNYHNCFILKLRKATASSGLVRYTPAGRSIKPIAGIYVLAAPTIDTANDDKGNIVLYRHMISRRFAKEFKAEDILHIYKDKRTGVTIGTPPLEAVRDDIISLRTIEQYAENMIAKNSSPFVHVKVGTDDHPARIDAKTGLPETDIYAKIIDNMSEDGGVATPHRVDIKMLGAESQALRLESYLKYYRERILVGLGMSSLDMGLPGGNGAGSAGISSNNLREEVRSYQKTINDFISNYLFNELLLESEAYEGQFYVKEKDRVSIEFVDSDIDKRIKVENHVLTLYNSKIIDKQTAANQLTLKGPVVLGEEITKPIQNKKSENIVTPQNQYTNIKDSLDYVQDIINCEDTEELLDILIKHVLHYCDINLNKDDELLLISYKGILKLKNRLSGSCVAVQIDSMFVDLCNSIVEREGIINE